MTRWCAPASIRPPRNERRQPWLRWEVSDAIRLLMVRIANEQRMPFDVRVPNSVTIEAMDELGAGKGQRFETPEGLFSDLDI